MRIIFSQKQLNQLIKQYVDTTEVELDKQIKEALLSVWGEGRHQEFINELHKFSDQNIWKVIKPDLIYWFKVFNIIDDLLAFLLGGENLDNNIKVSRENLSQNLMVLLKFVKIFIQTASNVNYYNSVEHLTLIFNRFPTNYQLREEVMSILISISAKQTDKKNLQQQNMESFRKQVADIMPSIKGLIESLDFVAELLINNEATMPYSESIKQYLDKKSKLDINQEEVDMIQEIQHIQQALSEQCSLEDVFLTQLRAINQYINVGENIGIQQSARLEHMLPPQQTIKKFIQILNTSFIGKKVQNQTINIMFLLIILDLNILFNYVTPQDNHYYLESCKHHDFYIQLIITFAQYHAYDKLKAQFEGSSLIDTSEMDHQLAMIKPLVEQTSEISSTQADIQQLEVTEMIKSQRVLNSFLNFMNHLLNIKNRAIQSQMYPQFLKPLLAIISVRPINYTYQININCQVKAAKLLKDVVKHVSIEDPGAVEKVIFRLKYEISIIQEDESKWFKSLDDDTESNILLMYKQDLIRTCLRFLCYSIIRNDPNAINFNQNFIANSRKILESNLIQNELINHVFSPNSENQSEQDKKILDPIILQCIQLVSYVFNDLPQKIAQFLENGVLSSIIDSLVRRIPLQPEVITLVIKFLQTICLNPEGAKLVIKSCIIERFVAFSRDSKAHRHIVYPQNPKALSYRDLIQQFCMGNQEISDQFYNCLLNNFSQLIERAWMVTQDYIEMEKQCHQDMAISDDLKSEIRAHYEKNQVALEHCFENASNLLWYYASDETTYGPDNIIYKSISAVKNSKDIFLSVVSTPIVASACPNMFTVFIEMMSQILKILNNNAEADFINKIISFLEQQVENVYLLIGSQDFDNVQDLEGQVTANDKIILSEINFDKQKRQLTDQLRGDDQIAVTFGKIYFYCEILIAKGNLSQTKQMIVFKTDHSSLITQLFKIQSMINRFHAAIYERDLIKEEKKYKELSHKYQKILKDFDYSNYELVSEPVDELDEAKNLYYKFVAEAVKSLNDNRARVSNKTVIELQLDENLSHTSNMCQQSIRKLLIAVLKNANKSKFHFSQQIDKNLLNFNKIMGKVIAEEFSEFVSAQKNDNSVDEIYIKKLCCQHSAILSEFNRALFSSFTSGYLIVEFIQHNGIEYVENISRWMIKIVSILDSQETLKTVVLCKHIQLLWSHVIDFYTQFLEAKYIDLQFNSILIAFKTNPLVKIQSEDKIKEEQDLAIVKMRKYFMNYFVKCYIFLFKESNKDSYIQGKNMNVFEYYDKHSELFFSTLVDLYFLLSKGMTHSKLFDLQFAKILNGADRNYLAIQSSKNYKQLKDMGFDVQSIENALEEARNNFDIALQHLLNQSSSAQPSDQQQQQENNKKQTDSTYKGTDITPQYTYENVLALLEYSFPHFLSFNATNLKLVNKVKVVETLFFILGSDLQSTKKERFLINIKDLLLTFIQKQVKDNKFSQIGLMASSLECMLRYRRAKLLDLQDIFKTLNIINHGFNETIRIFKDKIKWSETTIQLADRQEVVEYLKQIDSCLSLMLYIAEEAKSISDCNKLQSIITLQSSNNSNNEQPVLSLASQLEQIQEKNKNNIFLQSKEQTAAFLNEISLSIIEIFKSLHSVNYLYEKMSEFNVQKLLHHSIFLLNSLISIKGFADFDCQSVFLKNEGLNALYGIKMINETFQFQSSYVPDIKKYNELITQSKILLQQLCFNDQSQIKVYENQIKQILFIHYQERYKKEESKDLKSLFAVDDLAKAQNTANKTQQSQNKSKKPNTPIMKSQSMDLQSNSKNSGKQGGDNNTQSKSQSKLIKQLIRKNDYCEVLLTDFIEFFNNIKLIQDLRSFLIACSNICTIKVKPLNQKRKTSLDKNESKEQDEEEKKIDNTQSNSTDIKQSKSKSKKRISQQQKPFDQEKDQSLNSGQDQPNEQTQENQSFITLNNQVLKEMILQMIQSSYLQKQNEGENISKGTPQLYNKQQIQKFQQDIVFTILDQFIEQIREHQMLILQASKSKTNPSIHGINCSLNSQGQLIVYFLENVKSKKYVFDYISLIEHLTFVINKQPSLVSAILKHKDGKTFRFIVRNIYFIITLQAEKIQPLNENISAFEETKDTFRIWSEQKPEDNRWKSIVSEFFKITMPESPYLSINEKKVKLEARQLFLKEILKNIFESQTMNKYPQWPLSRLVFNSGSIWLISCVLAEEDKQLKESDKNIEELIKNMQKYRNIMRDKMVKHLINEAQLSQKTDQAQQGFVLLKLLEKVYKEIIDNQQFYGNIKGPIDSCMTSIVNILRPFEQKAIWGQKEGEQLNENLMIENSLGFMDFRGDDISIIDEEEDDNEEDDDDEDDSSEDQEDDDELLDSDPSERNFRFSEHDDEYGDEVEEDFLISEEDDQESSNFGESEQIQGRDIQIQLIEDDEDLDYDDLDYEDGSPDYEMREVSGQESNSQSIALQHAEGEEQEGQNNQVAIDQQIQEEGDSLGEDSYYTDEDDNSYDEIDGDSHNESSYYSEEQDEEDIEIVLGRDQNNIDRISVLNDGDNQNRANGNRRDIDLISFNNMSFDMLNLGGEAANNQLRRINEDDSQDDSQAAQEAYPQIRAQLRSDHRRDAPVMRPQNLNMTDFINSVIDHLNVNSDNIHPQLQRNGANFATGINYPPQDQLDNISHNPTLLIKDILNFKQYIQQSEELFKKFIGESQPQTSPLIRETSLSVQPNSHIYPNKNLDSDAKPKSLFSTQNPFNQNKKPVTNQQSIFGQIQTGRFNLNNQEAQQPADSIQNSQEQQIQQQNNNQVGSEQINTNQDQNNDLDPIFQEFLENVDEETKQNIVDTENIMNMITNQYPSEQAVNNIQQLLERCQSQEQRHQILLNLPEHDINLLPSQLFSEAQILRHLERNQNIQDIQERGVRLRNVPFLRQIANLGPIEIASRYMGRGGGRLNSRNNPQNNYRNRFISFDSQLNEITGAQRDALELLQRPGGNSPKVSAFSLRQNNLFSNIVGFLKNEVIDMDTRITYDAKGNDLDKNCEIILLQSLINTHDNIDLNYAKIKGLIQMTMAWIRIMNYNILLNGKQDKFIMMLLKIPTFRQGLLVSLNFYLQKGINQFLQFTNKLEDENQLFQEVNQFKLQLEPHQQKAIHINDFIIDYLGIFHSVILFINKISNQGVFDLIKTPEMDPNMESIMKAMQGDQLYNKNVSILEQILNQVIAFDKKASLYPKLAFSGLNTDDILQIWDDQLVAQLQGIIQNISLVFDRKAPDEQQNQFQFDANLIQKVGDLVLLKDFKSKESIRNVRKIFYCFVKSPKCQQIVYNYFKDSLSLSLNRFIHSLQDPKLILDKIQKEVNIITQILRISKILDKQDSNVCDENQFFEVVEMVSKLLGQKSNEPTQQQTFSFVFKDEFKVIMMALTILFEYNLRYIFLESDEVDPQTKKRQDAQLRRSERLASTSSAVMKASMSDIEEIKTENITTGSKRENLDIMESIEQHLQYKIKDPKVREDKRLKIFIKFCLEHKKLINSFIRANQQVLNQSIRNVIMKVPQILDFDNKRLLFRTQIKKMQKKYRLKYFDIRVRRDKVFDDSYQQLKGIQIDRWKGKMNVDFADEQGIDEGGLTREWFILISQEIFNPDLALFIQSNSGSTYYPNPKSTVQNEHKQLFQFIGRIVGKALYEQQLLDCYFVKAFYKIILGLPLNYHDVEDYDNELYKSLKWFLENNVDGTGFTFTETVDYFGENKEIELIPGGKDIDITEQNKFEYVQRMAFHKLYLSIQKQVDSFLKGFYEIIPKETIQIFDFRELELLVSGLPTIDIEDLKENTIYSNFTTESNVIKWLWEALEEFDNSERAEFIQFVTGSSKVPVEGFKGLRGSRGIQKFQIVKLFTNDHMRLPQAHTCFKQLELPEYISKENLKDRLMTAIKEGKTFGIA